MLMYHDLSYQVLGAAFTVHKSVGSGLLENIYQRAYEIELKYLGIPHVIHKRHEVTHSDESCGEYYSDLLVANKMILEIKAVKAFDADMEAQILNYMRLSKCRVGYLINFRNAKVQYKRFVRLLDN
ncbi:MAG: GxxExxY protein [Spirochaetia bacterium]